MKVIINNSVYKMTRNQLNGILDIAKKQVGCGIYAIEKDGVCELKNEKFDPLIIDENVKRYKESGFKVYYSG